MSVDIASLGLRIDSTEAADAAKNLRDVATAANDAEGAAGGTTSAFSKVGQEFEDFARHARNHVLSLAGASESTRAFTGILAHLPIELLLAGAAIAGIGVAYERGASEASDYAKALAETGNAADVTTSQLAQYAETVSKSTGSTHEAAAALTTLISTGSVAGKNLQDFAQTAIEVQKILGQTVEETAKNLSDLATTPLDTTVQLGKALGYLTPELYAQIQAYQQQGNTIDAVNLSQTAYIAAQKKVVDQVVPNLGILQKAWIGIKDVVSSVGNALTGLGRSTPLQDQLKALQDARGSRAIGDTGFRINSNQLDENDREEQVLIKLIAAQKAQADTQAAATLASKNFSEALVTQNTTVQVATVLSKAFADAQLANITRAFSNAQSAIQNQDDLLEAQRSANLLDDQDYYAQKVKLIQSSGTAEQDEITKQIAAERAEAAQQAALLAQQIKNSGNPAQKSGLHAQGEADAIASATKLKDLGAQLAQSQAVTTTKIATANIAASASVATLTRAYEDLVVQSDRYADSLQKQYQLTLAGAGIGDAARAKAQQQAQITQNIQNQLDANADTFRNSNGDAAARQKFDQTERILKDSLAKQQGDFADYYKNLQAQQSDWVNGFKDAAQNYLDAAKNVADLSNTAFTDAFKNMEDAIVTFATTGKFSFHDLANSLVADLVRMEAKILESQALSSIFSAFGGGAGALSGTSGVGAFTGGGGVQFAASGGSPSAGQPFIVGEQGPELFVPSQAGTIIPNNKLGSGGVNINSVNNFGPGSQVAALTAELDRRDAALRAQIGDDIGRGRLNTQLRNARF